MHVSLLISSIPNELVAPTCPSLQVPVDVLFVLDRSRSSLVCRSPCNSAEDLFDTFEQSRNMSMYLTETISDYYEAGIANMAAVSFSTDVTIEFGFQGFNTTQTTTASLLSKINNINDGSERLQTDLLSTLKTITTMFSSTEGHGARSEAAKFVLIFTDGEHTVSNNEGREFDLALADYAKQVCFHLVSTYSILICELSYPWVRYALAWGKQS